MLEELGKEELLELLHAYDRYIQNANDENRFLTAGIPSVSMSFTIVNISTKTSRRKMCRNYKTEVN